MYSVIIIARNEAKHILASIESAFKVTDDVVVVDSGSSDDTVTIAKKAGARVYEYGWHGYGGNKNFGNQQAKNDWIISIDGDEIISPALIDTINQLIPENQTVYQLNSMVNYAGRWIKHSGWYPRWKHRMFNRKECKWNDALVHEDLTPLDDKKIIRLKGDLLHYSYSSISEHKDKVKEYAHLKARKWIEQGKRPSIGKRYLGPFFNLLKTYVLKFGFLDGKAGWTIARIDATMAREEISQYDRLIKNSGL
ncbi:MAG: glycosyltransferase family 2 protein [Saprospiraceae bacterium]|nr:glycosyltransferase family 2 protein [Saprospiraceae bacterium]